MSLMGYARNIELLKTMSLLMPVADVPTLWRESYTQCDEVFYECIYTKGWRELGRQNPELYPPTDEWTHCQTGRGILLIIPYVGKAGKKMNIFIAQEHQAKVGDWRIFRSGADESVNPWTNYHRLEAEKKLSELIIQISYAYDISKGSRCRLKDLRGIVSKQY